jgi:hypothetical protein
MNPAAIRDNLNLLRGLRDQSGFKLAYDAATERFSVQTGWTGLTRTWGNRGKEGDEKQSVASNQNFIEPMRAIFLGPPVPGVSRRRQVEALQGLDRLRISYTGGGDRDRLTRLEALIAEIRARLLPPFSADLTRFLDRIMADRDLVENLSAERDGGHGIERMSPLDDAIYGKYCMRDKERGDWESMHRPPEEEPQQWVFKLWRNVRNNLRMSPGAIIDPYVQGHRDRLLRHRRAWPTEWFDYGFMWFRLPGEHETAFRVYLHPKLKRDPMAVYDVVNLLLNEKKANRLKFFKVAGPMHIRDRNDRIVVYCESEAQARALATALRGAAGGRFGKRLPPLTADLFPHGGIGIGEEPDADEDLLREGRSSFGTARAKAIANAIAEYRNEPSRGREILDCLVAQEFVRLRLNPSEPFRNLGAAPAAAAAVPAAALVPAAPPVPADLAAAVA